MAKNKTITRLTPAARETIRANMLRACQKIARENGLAVEDLGTRNMDPGLSFELGLRVSIPAPDGTAYNLEKEMFTIFAEDYGLSSDDFGREFNTGRERFKITGIDPKRPKYPISVERLPDRKGYKFAAEHVAMLLKAQTKHGGS
jgi:hypothetical protein